MVEKPIRKDILWTRDYILLSIANLLMFTAFCLLIPTLPVFITQDLGGDKQTVGIVLAAFTLAALLMRPVAGVTIDSLGRKTIYLIAFLVFTLIFNLYIIAASLVFLTLIRFLQGLTWGVTTTAGYTAVVDIIPSPRRGEGISFFGMSITLAMAVGPGLGIWICSDNQYDLLFFSAFVLSLMGWILAMLVRYPRYTPAGKVKISRKEIFERTSIPASLNLMLINATYGGVITYIAIYVKETGVGDAGMFFLVFALGVLLSRVRAGRYFDSHGPRWLMIPGLLLMTLSFPILALAQSPAGFYSAAIMLGLGGGVIGPCLQTMINNMVGPHRRGAANSTLFTALDLGIGLGMVIMGYLADKLGLSTTFLICAMINILALIHYLVHVHGHYVRKKITGI